LAEVVRLAEGRESVGALGIVEPEFQVQDLIQEKDLCGLQ
jgi:hypothetical protein